MGNAWKIGSVWGIPLRVHYTWFIILVLIVFSLIVSVSPAQGYPLWGRVTAAVITALLFFASIIIHELCHSLVAVKNGIPVKDITLFVFGGVSQITKEASRPKVELFMAFVGPLSSFALGGVFSVLDYLLTIGGFELAAFFAGYLAFINLLLGVFNLIPGFPLDGGRVLRSIIWMVSGSYDKATKAAAIVGRLVAYIFIFGGIAIIFGGFWGAQWQLPVIGPVNWFTGVWIAFIGWFLDNAASSSRAQTVLKESLKGFTARDVMSEGCPSVAPDLSVGRLVHELVLPSGKRCALVLEHDSVLGMVTLANIKAAPRENWDITPVKAIMTPKDRLMMVKPETEAIKVLEIMDENDVNQLPVVEDGHVIGMAARDSVIRFLRTKSELGM